jgi:putative ABC transport system permease protein
MQIRLSWFDANRLPIAWFLLLRFPRKFITAVAGIVFATVLILSQLGLRAALFDSSISIFKNLNADLVVINKSSIGSLSLLPFQNSRLKIFDRYPEVAHTAPIRYSFVRWRFNDADEVRPAIMVGYDPRIPTFNQEDILDQQSRLLLPGRILFDELSRKEFGPRKSKFKSQQPDLAFVNYQRVRVAGFVRIGVSFSYDACFLASLPTFEAISYDIPGRVEIGLVKLNPGIDAGVFLTQIKNDIPEDVRVFRKQDFLEFEKQYWDQSKPIGFVFFFNSVLGFIVGLTIFYQILYTDVVNQLPAFSMMLALAHTQLRLRLIVFQESFYLAAIGYPVGVLLCSGVFQVINASTGLDVKITISRAIICFLVIVLMSTCSALMAMLKLDDANPIEVFE